MGVNPQVGAYRTEPALELYQKLRNAPERVFTAAPTSINIQFIIESALEKHESIVLLGLASWASATYRNAMAAKAALPEALQMRVTCVDSGYVGCAQGHMTRELLRRAEAGDDLEAALARAHYVSRRSYHFVLASSYRQATHPAAAPRQHGALTPKPR